MNTSNKNQHQSQNFASDQNHHFFKVTKKAAIAFFVIMSLAACKENKEDKVVLDDETSQNLKIITKSGVKKETRNSTFLCKINGEDWNYTKASGIVSSHKKTKKRTAIITFTKKLEKGSETVQLFYDGDTYQLEKASVHLKQSKNDGGKMTAMYQLLVNGGKRLPDSEISGTLDLSNPSSASGTAKVSNMKMLFEEGEMEDQTMIVITLTPLSFEGIGYSDSEKLFGSN